MTSTRPMIAFFAAVLVALTSLTALASPLSPPAPADRDAGLWDLMSRYLEAVHERTPQSIGPQFGDERLNHKLGDVSPAAQAAWIETTRAFRDELAGLDDAGFNERDRLDRDLLVYSFERTLEAAPLKRWQMPVTSMGGPQVWLPQLSGRVPMSTREHRADYLLRLKQVPIVVGDSIDAMQMGIAEGRVPPKASVLATPAQAMAQASAEIREDPTQSPFYRPFLALDENDPLAVEAREVILERIVPVYQELAVFLQNVYIPACRDTVGISEGVDGPVAYDIAIRGHTTLPDATARTIHDIGLAEVSRIRAEMMEVIAGSDWDGNDRAWMDDDTKFASFVEYLRTDSRFYFDDPMDLLNAYKVISKDIDGYMPELFAALPRLPYGVRPIPPFAAKAAPTAFYYPGSVESGIPGYFMANLDNLRERPKYDIVALTLHEGVPGHHHQIALAQEMQGQHPLRTTMGFTAFSEGWGLYAERLGLEVGGGELGMYSDSYDNFGRLNYEMWRAMRLVVDTGMHAFGWSRDRAIAFMQQNSALSNHNIEAEVDRYIGWPGQATAYKIGQLWILELRGEAERLLGDAFDVREFHDAILESGAIPLPVLEAKMDRWLEEQVSLATEG